MVGMGEVDLVETDVGALFLYFSDPLLAAHGPLCRRALFICDGTTHYAA